MLINESRKRISNVNLQDHNIILGAQDIINFKPYNTEIFQVIDKEIGTRVVHTQIA